MNITFYDQIIQTFLTDVIVSFWYRKN